MIRVLFVCHGNICRSTMAQSVLADMVEKRGVASCFVIDSAATSTEEIGNPPHRGTVQMLQSVGIPLIDHRARRMTREDYAAFDYLIGMDSANLRNMQRIAGGDPDGKIYRLLSFAGRERDVADPWYTDDFAATYRDVCAGLAGFLRHLGIE